MRLLVTTPSFRASTWTLRRLNTVSLFKTLRRRYPNADGSWLSNLT